MTFIPPNINVMGSILQAQNSAREVAKNENARRNQEAQDSRKLARISQQQQEEVETTEKTDEVIVRRHDDQERDGFDAQDEYRQHEKNNKSTLYNPQGKPLESQSDETPSAIKPDAPQPPAVPPSGSIIDLSI